MTRKQTRLSAFASVQSRPADEIHSRPETPADLLEAAARYASTVAIDVDVSEIEWEVSTRAKRRAGACIYERVTERITIRLTWDAYEAFGWAEFAGVIRHELVHAWEFQHFGASSHGVRFKAKARELEAPRHCRSFTEERLRLVCTSADCDWTAKRHRASAVVTAPESRRCGACHSPYLVEHAATGECWETNAEYRTARERIGEEW